MKKLFFCLMALTIGAFTFTSCEKDDTGKEDNKKENNEKYLSIQEQQAVFTKTLGAVVEQLDFTGFAQKIQTIVQSVGYDVNWNAGLDALAYQDPVLARKIGAMKALLESEEISFDFGSMYFEADIAFKDTVVADSSRYYYVISQFPEMDEEDLIDYIEYDSVTVPVILNINHSADKFKLNINTIDNHVISMSLKGKNDTESRITYVTPEKTTKITAPDMLELSLDLDGVTLLSLNGKYSTDFNARLVGSEDDEDEIYNDEDLTISLPKLSEVTLTGKNLSADCKLAIDMYSVSADVNYNEKDGVKYNAYASVAGNEVLALNGTLDVALDERTNWAEPLSILSWATDYEKVRGVNVNAKLGGDQITIVAGLKENPLKYPEISAILSIFGGNQPDQETMVAMVDKFNELFTGEIYFKGYDKPQATFKLCYTPKVGTKAMLIDMDNVKSILDNSGLSIGVTTFDSDGNEMTVTLSDYFEKIDFEGVFKKLKETVINSFSSIIPLLSGKEEVDYGYIK